MFLGTIHPHPQIDLQLAHDHARAAADLENALARRRSPASGRHQRDPGISAKAGPVEALNPTSKAKATGGKPSRMPTSSKFLAPVSQMTRRLVREVELESASGKNSRLSNPQILALASESADFCDH